MSKVFLRETFFKISQISKKILGGRFFFCIGEECKVSFKINTNSDFLWIFKKFQKKLIFRVDLNSCFCFNEIKMK